MSSKWGFKTQDKKTFYHAKVFFLILSQNLYQVMELEILLRDLCYESRDKMSRYCICILGIQSKNNFLICMPLNMGNKSNNMAKQRNLNS